MTLTQTIILAAVAAIAVVDVILLLARGMQATISRTLYTWSQRYPILAFLVGGCFGHIFWPNC